VGSNPAGSSDTLGAPSRFDKIQTADAWKAWICWVSGRRKTIYRVYQ